MVGQPAQDRRRELQGLRLVQGQTSRDLNARQGAPTRQGYFEWKGIIPVDLVEGGNSLAVEAVNAGGRNVTPVTLTSCDPNGTCLANVSFNLAAGGYFVEARATFSTP